MNLSSPIHCNAYLLVSVTIMSSIVDVKNNLKMPNSVCGRFSRGPGVSVNGMIVTGDSSCDH